MTELPERITIIRPDDMHLHLRDGDAMASVLPFSASQVGRAVIMPNLKPPVITVDDALCYRQRILDARPADSDFIPLMTLYLTDRTTPQMVKDAKVAGIVAFKLYPAGATTNSESGVTNLFALVPVLEQMAQDGVLLLVHGEVTDSDVDIFDREAVFIERVLSPLMCAIPDLKIVFEHVTTSEAAQFVVSSGDNLAATVTPQHLLFDRNDLLVGGIKPHLYCLPVLKRAEHREKLLDMVTGNGSHKFFMGTDSAPHARHSKECACGCAGIFNAHAALAFYAQAFEQVNALDKLEAFTSMNGAEFYGLPKNQSYITLIRNRVMIDELLPFEHNSTVVPLGAGERVQWSIHVV